jgi:hypothetical protein
MDKRTDYGELEATVMIGPAIIRAWKSASGKWEATAQHCVFPKGQWHGGDFLTMVQAISVAITACTNGLAPEL